MSLYTLIILMSVMEMNGQNPWNNITKETTNLSPRQFVEKSQDFGKELLGNDYIVVISFENIPTKSELADLHKAGIQLLNYHSKNAYLAKVPNRITAEDLEKNGIKNLRKHTAIEKLSPEIKSGNFPEWAKNSPGKVDVAIMLNNHSKATQSSFIKKYNIELINTLGNGSILIGRVPQGNLTNLIESPMVSHLDAIEPEVSPFLQENRAHQKANVLQSSMASERNLTGEGIVVGIGDGGELGDHIDFNDRVINYANGTYSSFGAHGDHVSGIVGGAGNLNPVHKGMAPEVTLLIQKTTSIINNAYSYYADHEMVMTNNSYGVGYNCISNGTYNYSSNNLDKQSREMPDLLHVYAAGNSGYSQCGNYPTGFKSVLRYYQSAKNVLTVANAKEDRTLNGGSSKGPVNDGRIKPEIAGIGTNVFSTNNVMGYQSGTGTSMASPSVMGNLVLLNQRYRQLNNDEAPAGALMKAIACNTADDLGNLGPDYSFGFGLINSRRAVECIENNQYDSDELSNSETKTFNIDVPAGVGQVKVMLYWHDPEAPAYAPKTLINDLDLSLTTPGGTVFLPWVLNHDTLHVEDLATRMVDTLNNIEQVTLDNPAAGTYTITVDGTSIATGPQEFFITYDFISTDVVLTYPYGKESFEPGSTQILQWDTDINNSSDFTIEYSNDGGNTWSIISSNVPSGVRHYIWSVPSEITENGVIKITKNGTSITNENIVPFYILTRPTNLSSTPVCEGYVELTWDTIPEATSYEIYMLSGPEMVVVDEVTTPSYTTGMLTIGESNWFAVRGKTDDGAFTERSIATEVIAESGGDPCAWNYNISLNNILVNNVGRAFTELALTDTEPIAFEIINVGVNDIDSFEMRYQIGTEPMVTEMIYETIASGDTLVKTFSTTANLSDQGVHLVNASLEIGQDAEPNNNFILGTFEVHQIENAPISLPYDESFENISENSFTENTIGLTGIKAWDFIPDDNGNSNLNFVNEGTNKCLEVKGMLFNSTDDGMRLTMNMSNYSVTEDIMLQLDYKYTTPNTFGSLDSIYVRGSDLEEWIPILELASNQTWTTTNEINLSNLLTANGQSFSPSTQLHFSQGKNSGYAIDNISLKSLNALPVELTYFNAEKKADNTLLTWETALENNNEQFEIEVATDLLSNANYNFERIGTVSGNGTTTTNQYYTFLDILPKKSGFRYYRLKQVNSDGSFEYSEIRAVEFEEKPILTFYPNPFTSKIQVQFEDENLLDKTVQVYNATGEIVYEAESSGQNETLILNIKEKLPSGMYFLKVITDTETLTYPILKSEK